MFDTLAAKKRCEAATKMHRELEAIPRSVCLECQQAWPCDAVELAADCAAALEALEEAQGKIEAVKRDHVHPLRSMTGHPCKVCAILGESE